MKRNDDRDADRSAIDASEAARTLGALGASKGGKARAEKLSPEERSEIAKRAVEARWSKRATAEGSPEVPKATHRGLLRFADIEIPCYVLADERRVLSRRGVIKALGMSPGTAGGGGDDRLGSFASSKAISPYATGRPSLMMRPFEFQTPNGARALGSEATILADVCEAVLAARQAGALLKQQEHIAEQCEILVRGFARVGIIALVDEATGYQEERARDELHRILELYIAKELLPWTKRFPDEFYEQMFRLQGWEYPPQTSKRPKLVGKLTEQLVYRRLPLGVLEELRTKNPVTYRDGSRKQRHHQLLTEDIGNPHLEKQVVAVTTLMRVARDWSEFKDLFARSDPKAERHQARFPFSQSDSEDKN